MDVVELHLALVESGTMAKESAVSRRGPNPPSRAVDQARANRMIVTLSDQARD